MYIGLDIGTSGTKAALVSENGSIVKSFHVSYGFENTRDGRRELNADRIWEAVQECLKAVGKGRQVKSLTVSALGEAIILTDTQGNPLMNSIAGTDARGSRQLEELIEKAGREELIRITGVNLSNIYSVNKILWVKENCPGLFEKVCHIFTFQDYILFRLTGEKAIDYSMASRTLLFDGEMKCWSEKLFAICGLSRKYFSKPLPPGSIVGKIRPQLSRELGLSGSTYTVCGTHDHICNAIGSGVCRSGWCANTAGTTEGLTAVLEKNFLPPAAIDRYQISCEPFALEGLYNTVAWENTSGILLKWFVEQFMQDSAEKAIIERYRHLNENMDQNPTSLFVVPHFSGAATPYMDEKAKGAILGLTLSTTREDIYKAIMEGINLELALILEALKGTGLFIDKLVATGGSLSGQLLQLKADLLGMQIATVNDKETGVLGGAILGAAAVGDFASVRDAVKAMTHPGKSYDPDQSRNRLYREKLEEYREIYPALKKIRK